MILFTRLSVRLSQRLNLYDIENTVLVEHLANPLHVKTHLSGLYIKILCSTSTLSQTAACQVTELEGTGPGKFLKSPWILCKNAPIWKWLMSPKDSKQWLVLPELPYSLSLLSWKSPWDVLMCTGLNQTLTSLFAPFDYVAINASSSESLGWTPLQGTGGICDVIHHESSGLACWGLLGQQKQRRIMSPQFIDHKKDIMCSTRERWGN